MDYLVWFSKRLTDLRQQKGVSSREMSLALGQSESYINKIENKRALPSMLGFIYICEYLNVSPAEFFDIDNKSPNISSEITKEFSKLSPDHANHILKIIKDLNEK